MCVRLTCCLTPASVCAASAYTRDAAHRGRQAQRDLCSPLAYNSWSGKCDVPFSPKASVARPYCDLWLPRAIVWAWRGSDVCGCVWLPQLATASAHVPCSCYVVVSMLLPTTSLLFRPVWPATCMPACACMHLRVLVCILVCCCAVQCF
jgi:hypothetical protein